MLISKLCLTLAVLVATLKGQTSPARDPNGWTTAKWGMTKSQLKALFPKASILKMPNEKDGFGIGEYEIDQRLFEVMFGFDENSGGLNEVLISPNEHHYFVFMKPDLAPSLSTIANYMDDARDFLLKNVRTKYGKPNHESQTEDNDGAKKQEWQWLFPRSELKVSSTRYKPHENGDVVALTYVVYTKRTPSDRF